MYLSLVDSSLVDSSFVSSIIQYKHHVAETNLVSARTKIIVPIMI